MKPNGSVVRVLAQNSDQFGDLSPVSPNGKLVAYGNASGLVVERIDGSHRHVVVPPPRSCHSWACAGTVWVWSPFSNALLVTGTGPSQGEHLSIVSARGGKGHRILGPLRKARYFPLAWSGAAHKIAYLAWREYPYRSFLAIAGSNGRSRKVICSACVDGKFGLTATWSPNGRWLGYTNAANGKTEILDVATGSKVDVPGGGTPLWAPDSSAFAVPTARGVTFYSPTGGLLGGLRLAVYPHFWAWDTTGIYFTPDASPRKLHVWRPDESPPSMSTLFTLPPGQGILSVEPLK